MSALDPFVAGASSITTQPVLVQVLELLVAGGILNFVLELLRIWREGRRARRRDKPEVDGLVVKSAESAVLSMEKSLLAAERRINELEKREAVTSALVATRDARIVELEREVHSLKRHVVVVERKLGVLQGRDGELRTRVDDHDEPNPPKKRRPRRME